MPKEGARDDDLTLEVYDAINSYLFYCGAQWVGKWWKVNRRAGICTPDAGLCFGILPDVRLKSRTRAISIVSPMYTLGGPPVIIHIRCFSMSPTPQCDMPLCDNAGSLLLAGRSTSSPSIVVHVVIQNSHVRLFFVACVDASRLHDRSVGKDCRKTLWQ